MSQEARTSATERDPRWAAVVSRDATFDGRFVYAVRTTGVYCRPSCPARPARPHNVELHAGCAEAEAAGFRACRRCRPNEPAPRARQAVQYAIGACALGAILVARSPTGICAILLGDEPGRLAQEMRERFPQASPGGDDPALAALLATVASFVERPVLGLDLPLDIGGTTFQRRVWQAVRAIPAGRTMSYAGIAASIGAPRSARAVARACAGNTIAVAIPCHRVVRQDGAPSGYRWGDARRRALLAREALA